MKINIPQISVHSSVSIGCTDKSNDVIVLAAKNLASIDASQIA